MSDLWWQAVVLLVGALDAVALLVALRLLLDGRRVQARSAAPGGGGRRE